MAKRTGISNRESAESEARERRIFPPIETGRPPAEDASGSAEERPLTNDGSQTPHKAGSRSVAQKESGSRHVDHSAPSVRKVSGAYGKEPDAPRRRDVSDPLKKKEAAGP
jgi:hypothetical protein